MSPAISYSVEKRITRSIARIILNSKSDQKSSMFIEIHNKLNKEPTTVPHFLFANIFFYYTLTTRKFINGRFINGFREKQRGRRQSENQKFKILPLSQKNRFNLFENIASYSDFRPFAGVVRNVCF